MRTRDVKNFENNTPADWINVLPFRRCYSSQ